MLTRDLFAIAKFLVLFAAKLNFLYSQNYKMEFDLNNSLIQRAAAAVDIF